MCGVNAKQNVPEFKSLISNYDIVGFQETKTDTLDTVLLNNFHLHFKHHTKIASKNLVVYVSELNMNLNSMLNLLKVTVI